MAIWLASCKYAGAATKGSSVHSQKTVSSRRQRICASRCRLALSKQARRAPHQDADHHQEDEKGPQRSEEHTSELQSPCNLVCRLLLEKKKIPSGLEECSRAK